MPQDPKQFGRRTFVAGAVAAAVAACSSSDRSPSTAPATAASTDASSPTPTTALPDRTTFVSAGPRDRQQVALTFHVNGDPALAVRMLDLLRARQVTITAFMVGSWLNDHPDMAQRFLDDHHELANHTYTHPTFPALDRAAMTNEVTGCRDVLARLTGSAGRLFRPSGTSNGLDDPGSTVLEVAHAAGYTTVVGFDVDPADYQDPGGTTVAQRTTAAVQPGSIVSLHFGHAGTIEAMPSILDALNQRGLEPVAVSTLLAR